MTLKAVIYGLNILAERMSDIDGENQASKLQQS
jgi:hypothetical protein